MTARAGRDVLWAAAGSALLGGLLSAAWPVARRYVARVLTFVPLDALWLAPLGMVALVAGPALLFAAAAALRPWWRRPGLVAVLAASGWAVLLRVGAIHPLASLLLALGLAWRLAETARRRPEAWRRVTRLTTLAAAGGTALCWAAVHGGWALREARMRATRPVAAASAPNVLLLIIDTQRPGELGFYGSTRGLTPHLDSLAAHGTVFETAIAPSSWTLPSHASIFTGIPPEQLAANWLRPMQDTEPTLAGAFRGLGYRTALLGGNQNYVTAEAGLASGFEHVVGWKLSLRQPLWATTLMQTPPLIALAEHGPKAALAKIAALELQPWFRSVHVDRQRATDLTASLLTWLGREPGPPFFAAVNFFDVHEYSAPPAWLRRLAPRGGKHDTYRAALAYTDDAIGRLLASLEARGLLANTIVVLTSDHGEQWGEHGLEGHGNSVYSRVAEVPLLIAMPGGRGAGRRVRNVTSLNDLGASLLALAGAAPSLRFPGASFAAAVDGVDTARVAVCYLRSDTQAPGPARVAVYDERQSYVRDDARHTEEVFGGRTDTLAAAGMPARESADPAVAGYRKLAADLIAGDRWLRGP